MLRSILNKAVSGGRRTTPTATRGSTSGTPAGGSANQEIAKGATSLLRGLGRKRKGL